MCLAGILAIFTAVILSEKIAKPIKELCEFAKKLVKEISKETTLTFQIKN